MQRYHLDTNIVSHMMRWPEGACSLALRQRVLAASDAGVPCEVGLSAVVQYELLYGLERTPSSRYRAAYDLQMSQFTVFALNAAIGPHYARLRMQLEAKGQPIGPNDTLIAAHALALNATLVSADAEFARVPGLSLENWLAPHTN
jgi:tRNA(fMet)-specific endonuclease VapC